MQFTKSIHNQCHVSLIGHRKCDLKTVTRVRVKQWTLSFSAKMTQNAPVKVPQKFLLLTGRVHIWHMGRPCGDTQTGEKFLISQFNCGRGLGSKVQISIFGHFGGPHPSPNYFSDPKPKFVALYFRGASNGTTRDPLGPGIRVAKIRGAKQSV